MTETEMYALRFPAGQVKGKKVKRRYKEIPGETWKPIPGLANYSISDFGRVKQVRVTAYNRTVIREIMGHKEKLSGNRLYLRINDKSNFFFKPLGSVVYQTFTGIEIKSGEVLVYKDGDNQNNRLENLEVISRTEFNKRRKEQGLTASFTKTKVTRTKSGRISIQKARFSNFEISEIRRLAEAGISGRKIAELFKTDVSYITRVVQKVVRKYDLNEENGSTGSTETN